MSPVQHSSGGLLRRLSRPLTLAALLGAAALPVDLAAQAAPAAPVVDAKLFGGLGYRSIGPSRGGRVTTVTGHAAHPSTFYMGPTGGGVWKTEDYGITWRNVSDGFFASPSIGAIQVADSDPNVVYAGTGSDGIRSNVITGKGVYKSTDAGKTWRHVGLRDAGQIGAVEVHPTNPDLVYVAALGHPFGRNPERGVFRSRDGGASWDKVLFVADSIGAIDLELNPADPNEIYAAMWRGERKPWTIISGAPHRSGVGIYKSTDGGTTWRHITKGLPQGLVGKIDFAVSPANPDRVYALVEAVDAEEGLYRSDDRGESWTLVGTERGLMDRPFYYTNVDVDPTNADVVYVSATQFWKSTDGGKSWQRRPTPHGDNHDLWINPRDPRIMVQANDGGANVTLDGGETWSTQLNQSTAELYQVAVDNRFPYYVYAGQQDNTTIGVPSDPVTQAAPDAPLSHWIQIGGCETGPAVPKPDDWRIVYSNCKGRFGRYSHVTGQEQVYVVGLQNLYGHNPRDLKYRFQRVSPIHVSPHDPNTVYHASQFLHRTTDGGKSWETISPDLTANQPEHQVVSGEPITRDVTGEEIFSTIYAVEESPLQRGVIWVGSNDGVVSVTRDGGKSWQRVTPRGLPEDARIQTVEASPHQAGEAYIAAYRYLLDDWKPYIFRTTDFGRSWTLLTDGRNGIPADFPTRVIREDPARDGLLYAGTEWGMFVSFDEGRRWDPFQLNLPVTPITDIVVHRNDLVLSTMGRGFWVLDDLTRLHQLTPQVAAARAHLFQPDAAYRVRYSAGGSPSAVAAPSDPQYAPPGAIIDYWLREEPVGELKLEILDAEGRVVRAFGSEAAGEAERPVQGMRAPQLERTGTPRLAKTPGAHRFVWDLAHPGPWNADARRSGRNGPLAVPGRYQVRLSAGEWSETRPLEVRVDPRVAEDGVTPADLQAQLELAVQVRDLLGRARMAAARVEATQGGGEALARARAALITSREGSYPQPMLVDQIDYLYDAVTSADQRPGRDAYERFAELRRELEAVEAELERVTTP